VVLIGIKSLVLKVIQVFDCMRETAFCRGCIYYQTSFIEWGQRMKIFIESLDRGVWDAVVNGPYVLKTVINGESVDKP